MKRRAFIAGLGSAAAWPLAARAQQGDRIRRIGVLIGYDERDPEGKARVSGFTQGLASGGIGSLQHVSGELFKMMTRVHMVHVPYRGSIPALNDLLAGQVQVMFDATASSLPHIRTGKLRPLAATSATRSELLPDLPTVSDFVPGYEVTGWVGLGTPQGTAAEIISKLNKEINAAPADPKIKTRLADLGSTVLPGSPADFGKLIADETEKWGKVIKFAGIKAE